MTNNLQDQWAKERGFRVEATKSLTTSEQNVEALKKRLADEESARKNADLAVSSFQRQAADQGKKLKEATDQLKAFKEKVSLLMNQLEEAQRLGARAEKEKDEAEKARAEAEKAKDEAEQRGYDEGVAETEDRFRNEVPIVCRAYCAQTWEEALNRAGIEPSSELRRPENTFFPSAIRALSTPDRKSVV